MKTLQLNLPDLCAYGEVEWSNIHLFVLGKNHQRLKTFCFVFRNGCLLLVREQLNKKKQVKCSLMTFMEIYRLFRRIYCRSRREIRSFRIV